MNGSLLAGGLMIALLSGCAGYKVGPTNGLPAGSRSIEVRPVLNRTLEMRLGDPVTRALRRQIQQDGSFRLATRKDGDWVLEAVLVRWDRLPLSSQPDNILTPKDYTAELLAHVIVRDRSSGKTVWERDFTARTVMRSFEEQAVAERQGATIVADTLARKITAELADGSW